MNTRSEISFVYPEFQESPRHLCRRVDALSSRGLRTHLKEKFSLAPSCQLPPQLKAGDWVGLTLDSKKKKVLQVQLLAPQLRTPENYGSVEVWREWQVFLRAVREFFYKEKILEVQTPTLTICPGTEPFLDVFQTEFKMGQRQQSFYLPTSPELHLKKLISSGWGPLFEIRPCFRNGEISPTHQPEFWMLEWYRPGQNLKAIKKDCEKLIRFCSQKLKRKAPRASTSKTLAQVFRSHLKIRLQAQTSVNDLRTQARDRGIDIPEDWDFDDVFYFLFIEKIERKLKTQDPLFLENYPPSQAALARLTTDGWGDRFELYWKGFEIANAYHELNDPVVQRQRTRQDLEKRKSLGKPNLPLDEKFFEALEAGMPPTAGIALGLERLFLALTDRQDLKEIRPFFLS